VFSVKWVGDLCECKKKYDLMYDLDGFKLQHSFCGCDHNLLNGLKYRHKPSYSPLVVSLIEEEADNLKNYIKYANIDWCDQYFERDVVNYLVDHIGSCLPTTMDDVIQHKPLSKRKRSIQAKHNILTSDRLSHWSKITSFVKNERMSAQDVDTELGKKPPRLIQARSAEFVLLFQQYLKPIEWAMERHPNPLTNKSMNHFQTFELLESISDDFDDPVYLLLDHSAFDSGVNTFLLRTEHKIYLKIHGRDNLLETLCNSQINNKCRSIYGKVKYSVKGTRMSGDPNTACGNSIVNLIYLALIFNKLKYRPVVCGDDSVVCFERRDIMEIIRRMQHMDDDNHYLWRTKYKIVEQFKDIDFCQCKPDIFSRCMVKDAVRTISRSMICINNNVYDEETFKQWATSFYNNHKWLDKVGMTAIHDWNYNTKKLIIDVDYYDQGEIKVLDPLNAGYERSVIDCYNSFKYSPVIYGEATGCGMTIYESTV
jgi:hypothetical protein